MMKNSPVKLNQDFLQEKKTLDIGINMLCNTPHFNKYFFKIVNYS